MKTIITGTAGFIGSNLVRRCNNVFPCDIVDSSYKSPEETIEFLKTEKSVKCVYHLGAISSTTETDLSLITENNIKFSCDLLQICIEKDIPFVYASSASVYGLGEFGFDEDSRLNPLNYYAISKTVIDMFVKQKIIDHPKAKIVGLRYFNVYGHNEDHKNDMASPVHKFLQQSKSGTIKVFEGSENFRRDFVHVDDVVAITKAAVDFLPGIYNVGTGTSRTFLEVAKIISDITKAKIEKIPFPTHLIGKYQDFTCSNNEEINLFYRKDRISLEAGIRKVYEDRLC